MDDLDKMLHNMLKQYGFCISNDSYYGGSLSFENDELLVYIEDGEILMFDNVTDQVYNRYNLDPFGSDKKSFQVNCRLNLADPECFKKMIRIIVKARNKR